jgi:hypothetical protein
MSEQATEKQEIAGRTPKGKFAPGFSGNPDGRPKFSVVSILKERLAEVPEGQKRSRAEQLVDEILNKALLDKDTLTMRDILDRVDGKPKQAIVGGDEDDPPINASLVVTFVKPDGK